MAFFIYIKRQKGVSTETDDGAFHHLLCEEADISISHCLPIRHFVAKKISQKDESEEDFVLLNSRRTALAIVHTHQSPTSQSPEHPSAIASHFGMQGKCCA